MGINVPEEQQNIIGSTVPPDHSKQNIYYYTNTDTEIISITSDKCYRILIEHQHIMESRKEWITPAGLFLAFLTTIVTAEFHDFVLKAAVWEALFWFLMLWAVYWLIRTLPKIRAKTSVDDILVVMKRITKNPQDNTTR